MEAVKLKDFKGVNNRANENKMPDGFLRECVNFDIENGGLLRQRLGYINRNAGIWTALWSDGNRCFGVKDNNLVEVNESLSSYPLLADVGFIRLDFAEADGNYYFVGNAANGKIGDDNIISFGITPPASAPALSATSGTMQAGIYQIAVSYVDADGFESGVNGTSQITLTDNQQISLTNIPVSSNDRVTHKHIYVSQCNGKEVYRDATITNATTTHTITNPELNKIALKTFYLSPAPYGDLIEYFYGRLYIANDRYLYYSQVWDYEHWDLRNYFEFQEHIKAIMPCDDGMWISADALYWISGRNVEDFARVKKHDVPPPKFSQALIPKERVGIENYSSHAWMVTTSAGILMLLNGGEFINVSQANVKLPNFSGCGSAIIDNDDSFRYIAIMRGAGVPESL